ncbi:response regulator [bacterium]|nr:response regulator [bacterium]
MNKKILIVDDSQAWLSFHKELITDLYGDIFEITTANSAFEAYEIIRKNIDNPFCLVITDMQMELAYEPQFAGEWLIEKIKELSQYYKTQIIIVSGVHSIEKIAQEFNVDCISKAMLLRNKLLMKFTFEKLMPFLNKIN